MGAAVLWRRRREPAAGALLAVTVAVTAVWAYVLLDRTPDFLPWLRAGVSSSACVGRARPAGRRGALPRPGGAPWLAARRARRRAGRTGGVRGGHGGHRAHRLDPVRRGRRVGRWRLRRPGRWRAPAAASRPRGGFSGGHRRRRAAAVRHVGRRRDGARRRADRQAAAGGGGDRRPARRRTASAAMVTPAAGRRRRRTPGSPRRSARNNAAGLPARHRRAGDGDRRLQRQRPVADAGPVPAVRGRRQDPLLHRRRRRSAAPERRAAPRLQRDRTWVAAELHRHRPSAASPSTT